MFRSVATQTRWMDRSIYCAARFFFLLCRMVPRRVALAILDVLAGIFYHLDMAHRHIVRVNLAVAFPGLADRQADRIGRRSYQNVAKNLLEVSRLRDLTAENVGQYVDYDPQQGWNNFIAARSRGKPILYLTGHFSAWEILPAAHALFGNPLNFVTRPLDNLLLENYLRGLRESVGNRVLHRTNSAKEILAKLKAGEDVGILLDQNTSLQHGIFSNFFGIPASTTTSLALIALRTQATVLPGYLTPMQRGKYRIRFLPPLDLICTGDRDRDVRLNTDRFNQILEGIVKEFPEAWLWGHKRWKNRPPESPDLYGLDRTTLREFLQRYRSHQP